MFVETTRDDPRHDLTFPGGQRLITRTQSRNRFLIVEASPIALEAKLDCVQQILVSKGLGQKLHRTPFHCLYRHGYVAMPSYKNDRKLDPARSKLSLKIEAALPRQPNVKDKA